jgi:hypothetical protein
MPWLVGVPPHVLSIGSGTIRGITTMHGMIAIVAMVGVVAIAIWQPRGVRPTRIALAGVLGIVVVVMTISSLVLGTDKTEIYDEIERIAPSREVADRMIVAVGEQLNRMDMGDGGIVLLLGCLALLVVAIIAMFLKRQYQPAIQHRAL